MHSHGLYQAAEKTGTCGIMYVQYTHTHVCVYIYVYMYIYIYIYIYTYMHMHVCMVMCMYICIHAGVFTALIVKHVARKLCHLYVYFHVHAHICMCVCINQFCLKSAQFWNVYCHIHIHIHIHTECVLSSLLYTCLVQFLVRSFYVHSFACAYIYGRTSFAHVYTLPIAHIYVHILT